MKTIYLLVLSLLPIISFSQALEEAREVKITQLEFNELTQTGLARVSDCDQCPFELYTFTSNLEVSKNFSKSSIPQLLSDYWNSKLTVIFIKPDTNQLLRIEYRNK